MLKRIEIVIYKYNGNTNVEGINDEGYTYCQIPLEDLGITLDMIDTYNKIYRKKLYIEGEIKDIEGEYIINGKKLTIERKIITIEL